MLSVFCSILLYHKLANLFWKSTLVIVVVPVLKVLSPSKGSEDPNTIFPKGTSNWVSAISKGTVKVLSRVVTCSLLI